MLSERDIKKIEEKEPTISKECYTLYSTTSKTLKQVANEKEIPYNRIKHYSRYYKYKQRIDYYNMKKKQLK